MMKLRPSDGSGNIFLRFMSLVILIVVVESLHSFGLFKFIPAPSAVFDAFGAMFKEGILVGSAMDSLSRVLHGFFAAFLFAIPAGYWLARSRLFKDVIFVPFEVLRPIPPIAWIPLAIIIFGIGDLSAYFVIFIGAVFPLLTNTELGVRNIRPQFIEVAKMHGARGWSLFRHVIMPAALPSIFSGVVIALGFSWMVVVAAEMVAANTGLGYQIQVDRQLLRLDRVVAGMLAIGVLGYALISVVRLIEWFSLPWLRVNQDRAPRDTVSASSVISPADKEQELLEYKVDGAKLNISGLSFSYDGAKGNILNNLGLQVAPAEVLAVMGESGSGKSTLLRLVANLEEPKTGSIKISAQQASSKEMTVSMLFQNLELFPWKRISENVAFPLQMSGRSLSFIVKNVDALLNLVGLKDKRRSYPSQLSGGQMQRVALVRALAARPKLLLMDEPFSGLDMDTRERLQYEFSRIFKASGMTVIMVTHDVNEACYMADRIAILTNEIHGMLVYIENEAKDGNKMPKRTDKAFHKMSDRVRERIRNPMKSN